MTYLTSQQWAVIEAEFISGTWPVVKLASHHNVGVSSIYRRVRTGNWLEKRRAVSEAGATTTSSVAKTAIVTSSNSHLPLSEEAFCLRLIVMIDKMMCEIENDSNASDARTPSDRERDARTMGAIMRIVEKLHEQTKPASNDAQAEGLTLDDDTVCARLSQEIDKLDTKPERAAS